MNLNEIIKTYDILFVTFDTLRYDVAQLALSGNRTPNLAAVLPKSQWEERHTPGSFTYAAHQAFFAGFLPTPTRPGANRQARLFATRFTESKTTDASQTLIFDTPDIVSGFAGLGYHTICIGGVGFFNKQTPLGSVLPNLFMESHWSPRTGVSSPVSTEEQVRIAQERLAALPNEQRVFLFINISALHPPSHIFLEGATRDSIETQMAALAYVDSQLPRLFQVMQRRAPVFVILCSDHGTTFGEDGYIGHRIAHPVVWTVPYAHFVLGQLYVEQDK